MSFTSDQDQFDLKRLNGCKYRKNVQIITGTCLHLFGLEFIGADFQANAVLFRKYILTICQLIIYLITPLHPL